MPSERDDENEEQTVDSDNEETGSPESAEAAAPQADPNVPRNRAERRTAARAARRGREARLSDVDPDAPAEEVGALDPDGGLMNVTTSMGGNPRTLDPNFVPPSGPGPARSKVPPRTMSKGTGAVDGVPDWARDAGDRLTKHRNLLIGGAVAVLLAIGGTLGYQRFAMAREGRAADAYAEALRVAMAPIEAEPDPSAATRPEGPRFRTVEARLQAAVEKFRQVERNHPSSRIAPIARLNEANTLLLLGRYQEAKQVFEGLRGADTAGLEGRVVEGIAHAEEGLNNVAGAERAFRELQDIQSGMYRDEAQYALARLALRQNNANGAKELLRGVVERTRRVTAADPTAAIQEELRQRATAMLREIDPNDPIIQDIDRAAQRGEQHGGGAEHAHGGNALQGANPMQGLPPELRRQVEEMMRRQRQRPQGGAPGAPAAPAAPPAAPEGH